MLSAYELCAVRNLFNYDILNYGPLETNPKGFEISDHGGFVVVLL